MSKAKKKPKKTKRPAVGGNQEFVQFAQFVQQKISRFEQAFLFLQKQIKVAQVNLIVLNDLLEKGGFLNEEEFIKRFSVAEEKILLPQDLKGRVTISIYS